MYRRPELPVETDELSSKVFMYSLFKLTLNCEASSIAISTVEQSSYEWNYWKRAGFISLESSVLTS